VYFPYNIKTFSGNTERVARKHEENNIQRNESLLRWSSTKYFAT